MLQSLVFGLSLVAGAATGVAETTDETIELAVLALPDSLRDGAAVIRYEKGERIVLREGTNGLICQPDDPDVAGIAIWCYPTTHDAYARRWYGLEATGLSAKEVNDRIAEEIRSGELEWPDAAVNYNLRGPGLDNAVATTVVYVPFATGESLGITEERSFYRPWLMFPGTAFAHIMIPGQ